MAKASDGIRFSFDRKRTSFFRCEQWHNKDEKLKWKLNSKRTKSYLPAWCVEQMIYHFMYKSNLPAIPLIGPKIHLQTLGQKWILVHTLINIVLHCVAGCLQDVPTAGGNKCLEA